MASLPIRRLPRIVRRRALSRRRALQGLGALVGAGSLAGCKDDAAGDDELGESGSGSGESSDTGESTSESGDPSSDTSSDTSTDTTTGEDPYAACETSDLTPEEIVRQGFLALGMVSLEPWLVDESGYQMAGMTP